MKTILARGGIEFLAVFLGIALSLWVDDFREERELKERLNDDLIKIYNEVQANTVNIEKIIDLNEKNLFHEEKLLKILNKEIVYDFGETTAYRSSVSSGRFNTSKNDSLVRQLSRLYEHFFVRLKLNGDILDKQAFEFTGNNSKKFNKAKFKQNSIDTLSLTKYFFSDDFHNGLLGTYEIRKNYYMDRLKDTRKQLNKVKNTYHKYYFN